MKTKLPLLTGLLLIISAIFISCAATPTKFEEAVFEVKTNYASSDVVITNYVVKIQTLDLVTVTTNQVNEVITKTNLVQVEIPVPVLVHTNIQIPQYTYTTSSNTVDTVKTVGSVVNTFAPGVGELVGGVLLGLFAMWGKLRSSKNTGVTLAQNIEAIREFVKTLPDGAKYDQVIVEYLQKHQNEMGAAKSVLALLEKYVSNTEAKGTVQELKNALETLK